MNQHDFTFWASRRWQFVSFVYLHIWWSRPIIIYYVHKLLKRAPSRSAVQSVRKNKCNCNYRSNDSLLLSLFRTISSFWSWKLKQNPSLSWFLCCILLQIRAMMGDDDDDVHFPFYECTMTMWFVVDSNTQINVRCVKQNVCLDFWYFDHHNVIFMTLKLHQRSQRSHTKNLRTHISSFVSKTMLTPCSCVSDETRRRWIIWI